MMPRQNLCRLFLVAACLILPKAALAHSLAGDGGGFVHGFQHPLYGLDHLLAMFCVGLWGAQMGGKSVWFLPIVFPLVMVAGGMAGIAGIELPLVELGIALSVILLGAAIAFPWRPSLFLATPLIAVFAIYHGYAHGAELPNAADPTDYAMGFVMATGLIHLIGIAVGLGLYRLRGGEVARVLGAVISLGGVYFLVSAA